MGREVLMLASRLLLRNLSALTPLTVAHASRGVVLKGYLRPYVHSSADAQYLFCIGPTPVRILRQFKPSAARLMSKCLRLAQVVARSYTGIRRRYVAESSADEPSTRYLQTCDRIQVPTVFVGILRNTGLFSQVLSSCAFLDIASSSAPRGSSRSRYQEYA